MNETAKAAERLRRCKTEAPITVYCPKHPSECWTAEAHKVLAALREADEKLLAQAYLTLIPADSEEAIDTEWLASVTDDGYTARYDDVSIHVIAINKSYDGIEIWNHCDDGTANGVLALHNHKGLTRGQLRNLCAALGITLKEGGK